MSPPFRLLVHELFQEQLDEFLAIRGEAWDSLLASLRELCADPFNAGSLLQGLPPPLAGRVYKKWVHGRRGYRLIYLLYPVKGITLGVFLSTEARADFDYSDIEWQEYAQTIYVDLIKGNDAKFKFLYV